MYLEMMKYVRCICILYLISYLRIGIALAIKYIFEDVFVFLFRYIFQSILPISPIAHIKVYWRGYRC